MTVGLPLIKNEITPLAKSVSITLGLTSAATATDAAIQKKNLWIGASVRLSTASNCTDNLRRKNG